MPPHDNPLENKYLWCQVRFYDYYDIELMKVTACTKGIKPSIVVVDLEVNTYLNI